MKIVFVHREEKERFSLSSIIDAIKPLNAQTKLVHVSKKEKGDFYVYAHPAVLQKYNKRPAIGVEHGIAPFKMYTYGKHFLNYDYFLAPTPIWQKRLKDLYNYECYLGGFPKLDKFKNYKTGNKTLVIFSWGVNFDKVNKLPKLENVIYTFHPTAKKKFGLSNNIGNVIGDHSSLTLECAFLGLKPKFFIIRDFYNSNVNLPKVYFEKGISEQIELKMDNVIQDKNSLIDCIKNKKSFPSYEFPKEFFPPNDSSKATLECFKDILK